MLLYEWNEVKQINVARTQDFCYTQSSTFVWIILTKEDTFVRINEKTLNKIVINRRNISVGH